MSDQGSKAIPVIDAHHHFWNLAHCNYPWLMARGVKRFFGDPTPIQKNYLPADLLDDAGTIQLAGSVHIQVGVAAEDKLRETQWLQSLHEADPGLPSAIVADADLTASDFRATLEAHQRSSAFRGIRQIVGRHPSEDMKTGSAEVLAAPEFLKNLKVLADQHCSFDLQLTEAQYRDAFDIFAKVPDLNLVLCHFASPWDLSREGFKRWCTTMQQFASLPNCSLKFSGFGMFKPDWRSEDIKPYVYKALELFGAKRLLAGTNFPVDKLYGGYMRIWIALQELINNPDIYRQVCNDNATRFYRIALTDTQ